MNLEYECSLEIDGVSNDTMAIDWEPTIPFGLHSAVRKSIKVVMHLPDPFFGKYRHYRVHSLVTYSWEFSLQSKPDISNRLH